MSHQLTPIEMRDLLWACDDDEHNVLEVVKIFTGCGWLKDGDGIESLSREHAEAFIANPDGQIEAARTASQKLREVQELERRRAYAEKLDAERKAKRIQSIYDSIPAEFIGCTLKGAIRPRQYEFVRRYWTLDAEEERHDEDWKSGKELQKTVNGLFLTGPPGTGKSACAWMAYRDLAIDDYNGRYVFISSVSFMRAAKSKHVSKELRDEFNELFDRMLTTDILFIDDLGTERMSESAEEVLFELFNVRNEQHLRTLVTTNYTLEELTSNFLPKNVAKMKRRLSPPFYLHVDFTHP